MIGEGATGGPAPAQRCPKCGTGLPPDAAFCVACGLQSRDLCWECGRPLETAWRFCPSCGGDAGEFGVVPCPSCREPVMREQAHCTHCGTQARALCGSCDRILRRSWSFCPECGATAAAEGEAAEPRAASTGDRPVVRRAAPSTPFPGPGDVKPTAGTGEAESLNQQGIQAYERERFDEAIDLFRRAIALDSDRATFHCNLAVAYGEKRMDDEAFAEYQRTLELDPRNARALVDLGYFYSEREQYEEARDCWERAIQADPSSPEAGEARESLQHLEQL